MNRLLPFLLLVLLPTQAWATGLARAGCPSCHGPKAQEKTCVRCHTPGLRADRAVLYGNAPVLNIRYTREGLRRFLQAPVPRYGGKGFMFALTREQLATVGDFLDKNPETARHAPRAELVSMGQKIFAEQSCHSCHEGQGPGPRLRLGYPLLNSEYFTATLKQGRGRMPAFASLSPAAVEALYSYVSLTESKAAPSPQSLTVSVASGDKLYQNIRQNLQNAGCIHCHGSPDHTQGEVAEIFGDTPKAFFLNPGSQIDSRSRAALENGADCQNSVLVERLELRQAESQGYAHAQGRGMPLTGSPLSVAAISEIKRWTKLGCPNGEIQLCTPCQKKSSFGG